jgi:hypothetical protein
MCHDGQKDGRETDVDCGGDRRPCDNGKTCVVKTDCLSCDCEAGICARSFDCYDQKKDAEETDVDCGGLTCRPCALGKQCVRPDDCATHICGNGVCIAGPSCFDGIKNGGESAVDCGGPCQAKCRLGRSCGKNSDCQGGICANGGCAAPPTCKDGLPDGDESSLDCGGSCAPCANGVQCFSAGDCQSGFCDPDLRTCGAPRPTCYDGVLNQDETDIDCGGGNCLRCSAGLHCKRDDDCITGLCSGGVCAPNCSDCSPGTVPDFGGNGSFTCQCDGRSCLSCCSDGGGCGPDFNLNEYCGQRGVMCWHCVSPGNSYGNCAPDGICAGQHCDQKHCYSIEIGSCEPGNTEAACGAGWSHGTIGQCQVCKPGQKCVNFECK